MSRPAVEMRGVTKRFARVIANDDVDFTARPGEIHALVGENGAGKSTLMRILYGLLPADSGRIAVHGRWRRFRSPREAIAAGIGMVHQHFMLIGPMTVAENILLGEEPTRFGFLAPRPAIARIRALAAQHHLRVEPETRVADLGVGEQQRVEILKVLFRGVRVLILDEPTAVLTPQECAGLFRVLRALSDDGACVILITHRLEEVRLVADRVTIMRAGRVVGKHAVGDVTAKDLAREMVGREITRITVRPGRPPGDEALRLEAIRATSDRGLTALEDLSLSVRSGEILGVAGVEGNGQHELAELAAGLRPPVAGRIFLDGDDVTRLGRRDFLRRGVSFIPEDRRDRGLVQGFTLAENLVLGRHDRSPFRKGAALDQHEIRRAAADLVRAHDIRPPVPGAFARTFSGGNQQKAVVARELAALPRLLVASHPTRGVDVGAIESIHAQMLQACAEGAAVLLISAELSEVLALSHRIIVLNRGRIVAEVAGPDASLELLGRWMLGGPDGQA